MLYRFNDYALDANRRELRRGAALVSLEPQVPFVFDTLAARYGENVTETDRAMARAYNAYFAKSSNPNGSQLPDWPQVDPGRTDLMVSTLDNGPVVGPDAWEERLDIVERAAGPTGP